MLLPLPLSLSCVSGSLVEDRGKARAHGWGVLSASAVARNESSHGKSLFRDTSLLEQQMERKKRELCRLEDKMKALEWEQQQQEQEQQQQPPSVSARTQHATKITRRHYQTTSETFHREVAHGVQKERKRKELARQQAVTTDNAASGPVPISPGLEAVKNRFSEVPRGRRRGPAVDWVDHMATNFRVPH